MIQSVTLFMLGNYYKFWKSFLSCQTWCSLWVTEISALDAWISIVRIRSFSGPSFPAFGLNTERHLRKILFRKYTANLLEITQANVWFQWSFNMTRSYFWIWKICFHIASAPSSLSINYNFVRTLANFDTFRSLGSK